MSISFPYPQLNDFAAAISKFVTCLSIVFFFNDTYLQILGLSKKQRSKILFDGVKNGI
jgi:hypothetical protein